MQCEIVEHGGDDDDDDDDDGNDFWIVVAESQLSHACVVFSLFLQPSTCCSAPRRVRISDNCARVNSYAMSNRRDT